MRDFEKLDVFHRSVRFARTVYDELGTRRGPDRYEAISQLVRAADSIGANIAEGSGRSSNPDYARFLSYALGSTNEADFYLMLVPGRGLLTEARAAELRGELNTIRRMLFRLRSQISRPDE